MLQQIHRDIGMLHAHFTVPLPCQPQQLGVVAHGHHARHARFAIEKGHLADQFTHHHAAHLHLLALLLGEQGGLAADHEVERIAHVTDIGDHLATAVADQFGIGEQGLYLAHGQGFA